MAEAKKQETKKEAAPKAKQHYFTSRHSGLTIVHGEEGEDQKRERFQPFLQKDETGAEVKVGFLVTDDKDIVKRCQEIPEVQELDDEKDYERALKGAHPIGYPIG